MSPSNRNKLSPYATAYINERVAQEVDAQVASIMRKQKTDIDAVVDLVTKHEAQTAKHVSDHEKRLDSHATVMKKWLPAIIGRVKATEASVESFSIQKEIKSPRKQPALSAGALPTLLVQKKVAKKEYPSYTLLFVLSAEGGNKWISVSDCYKHMAAHGIEKTKAWGAILGSSQWHVPAGNPLVHYNKVTKKVIITPKGRERLASLAE